MSLPLLGSGPGSAAVAGGGGGTGPGGVTNLKGWWDASVTASLGLSGSDITSVADQSGSGHNLAPMSGITKPTYNASGLNSLPTMIFSNTTDTGLTCDPFALGTGNTLTLWAVATYNTACDVTARLVSYTAAAASHDYNNAGSFVIQRKGGNDCIEVQRNNIGMGFPPADLTNGTPFRLVATVKSDGTITYYVDGVLRQTSSSSGSWVSGGGICLGTGKLDATYWDGKISELGISIDYSDATAVAAIDAALVTKWGF